MDHKTALELVDGLLGENRFYAESGDPMLAKLGRANVTMLSVLVVLLGMVQPPEFDAASTRLGEPAPAPEPAPDLAPASETGNGDAQPPAGNAPA